jgi:LEA14-like dessication related protein
MMRELECTREIATSSFLLTTIKDKGHARDVRGVEMMSVTKTVALLAIISVSMSACRRIEPPLVELHGVRFAGIGLRGASLVADMRIENPNNFDIEADSITFTLEASDASAPGTWTPVTSGTNRERQRVAAGDRIAVEIPIELSYSDLSAPVRSVIDRGTFNYRVSGEVLVREPRRTTARFNKTGTLSITGGQ